MPGHGFTMPGQQREVLAQRVPLEVARQVDVAQVGVPGEGDAEHLARLALVPVGAGVDRRPGADRRASSSGTSALRVMPECCVRDVGRGRTPGSGCRRPAYARLDRRRARFAWLAPAIVVDLGVHVAAERRRAASRWPRGSRSTRSRSLCRTASPAARPTRRGATRTQRSSPGRMWLPTSASPSSLGEPRRASRGARARRRRSVSLGRPSAVVGRRRSSADDNRLTSSSAAAMSSFWMRSCSSTMPSSSASGRGGQPGT